MRTFSRPSSRGGGVGETSAEGVAGEMAPSRAHGTTVGVRGEVVAPAPSDVALRPTRHASSFVGVAPKQKHEIVVHQSCASLGLCARRIVAARIQPRRQVRQPPSEADSGSSPRVAAVASLKSAPRGPIRAPISTRISVRICHPRHWTTAWGLGVCRGHCSTGSAHDSGHWHRRRAALRGWATPFAISARGARQA